MNKIITLSLTLLLIALSNQTLADRESDLWQQFKAKQAMDELDAEFNTEPPQPETKIIERIIERERVVILPAPVPQPSPAPVNYTQPNPAPQPVPSPVTYIQPEPVSPPAPVSQPAGVTVESDGYIFKLSSCKLAHRNIKCQLTLTSVEIDGELTLFGNSYSRSSKLFDRNGNEYYPSNMTMGNKNNTRSVKNKYISGVNAKGSVAFENINANTKSIALLELSLHNSATNKYRRIQFRNVNLSL